MVYKVSTLLIIVILFVSCREGTNYKELSEDEKEAFMFYADTGDVFTLIRNNLDTIKYTIVDKEIGYKNYLVGTFSQYVSLLFSSEDNMSGGGVEYSASKIMGDDYIQIDNVLFVNTVSSGTFSVSVNDKIYYDVHLLTNSDDDTKAYVSRKYGILKMWNSYTTYTKLN